MNTINARIIAKTFELLGAGLLKGYTSRTVSKIAAECHLSEDTVRTALDGESRFEFKTRRSDGTTLVSCPDVSPGDMLEMREILTALLGKHKLRTVQAICAETDLTYNRVMYQLDALEDWVSLEWRSRRSDGAQMVGLVGYEPDDVLATVAANRVEPANPGAEGVSYVTVGDTTFRVTIEAL